MPVVELIGVEARKRGSLAATPGVICNVWIDLKTVKRAVTRTPVLKKNPEMMNATKL